MSSNPIPVVLFGKIPGHMEAVSNGVKPEYEITHTASSVEYALKILPSLLDQKQIQVAIMGGGFSPADFEAVYNGASGAKDIVWLRPDPAKMGPPPGAAPAGACAAAGGPLKTPPVQVIVDRVKKCLMEHHEDILEGKGRGEVWMF